MAQTFNDAVARNVNDIKSLAVWRAAMAEFLGTLLLVFVGCAVCLDNWQKEAAAAQATTVQISLTFGLAVATMVWCIAHISGGHINPAVTAAMMITRKITIAKSVIYILAQSAGAITGAGILRALHPADYMGDQLGNTEIQAPLNVGQALGIELIITFVLVFTVFACCDSKRKDLGGSIPLTIGLSITLCHLFAIKYTGSSMNPARSLGPAVVAWRWASHWVYWLGPISGGILAGIIYEFLFAVDASVGKFKAMLSPGGPNEYVLTPLDDREHHNSGGKYAVDKV